MKLSKSLVLSVLFHGLLLLLLFIKLPKALPRQSMVLEARLMFKDKVRPPDLLPRKKVSASAEKKVEEKPTKKVIPSKERDFSKDLAQISQTFSKDLLDFVDNKIEDTVVEEDGSYFEQIYALIKQSFVVPPHLNGPQGEKLRALLRLFLDSDGRLARVTLEHSSGDESFDNAVLDSTRRVNNFGAVPVLLQSALSEDGIVVEMCPFSCAHTKGG